jgi:O-antigen/teichoic acid export membrane protein
MPIRWEKKIGATGERPGRAYSALRYFSHPLVSTSSNLYAVQAVTFILPLLTVPYLSRVLGVATWGVMAYLQSMGAYFLLLVEFGFAFSATQEVARRRSDKNALGDLLWGVQASKMLLCVLGLAVLWGIRPWVSFGVAHPKIYWASAAFALAQGCNLYWFFLGLETPQVAAKFDIAARVAAACGVFIFVQGPDDAWKVAALQAAGAAVSGAFAFVTAVRSVGMRVPGLKGSFELLRRGFSFFCFRAAENVYIVANPMLLGWFAGGVGLGAYSAAERLTRTCLVGIFDPLHRAMYARVQAAYPVSQERAAGLMRRYIIFVVLAGLGVGVLAFTGAPLLVDFFLGAEFKESAVILRMFSLLPLIIALKWGFGLHWMVAIGRRRTFNNLVFASALLHILLAGMLVPGHGPIGMAATVIITELSIPLGCIAALWLSGQSPFKKSAWEAPPIIQAELRDT